MISVTPDGLINFVFTGYGGRISDEMIVSVNSYLDLLKPSMHVMADRVFKKNWNRGYVLVRPASVSSGVKSCKKFVLESQKIAGLRFTSKELYVDFVTTILFLPILVLVIN